MVYVAGLSNSPASPRLDRFRAISLLDGEFHTPCELDGVLHVVLDVRTNTLLLLVQPSADDGDSNEFWTLVSLRREGNTWVQCQRRRTEFRVDAARCFYDLLASESRVLLGMSGTPDVYLFELSAEHSLRPLGSAAMEEAYYYMAFTRLGTDFLVASSHRNAVSLRRVVEQVAPLEPLQLQLETLSRIELTHPTNLLFCRDGLLVAVTDEDCDAIVCLDVTGGRFAHKRQLLSSNSNVQVSTWCMAGDKLVVYNGIDDSSVLLVFAFE